MKVFRKKFFKLSLSIFFLMLYGGVYLSSGFWHNHSSTSDTKSLSYSKAENCDYCKLISNETFELGVNDFIFLTNEIISTSNFIAKNIFSPSVLNQQNKAPPAQA
ncbi:MAG: hypothetical protein NT150_02230 [Bacteroidetes bacterium]|nr:hypothetical protein [Bacteroidota bacterium]